MTKFKAFIVVEDTPEGTAKCSLKFEPRVTPENEKDFMDSQAALIAANVYNYLLEEKEKEG